MEQYRRYVQRRPIGGDLVDKSHWRSCDSSVGREMKQRDGKVAIKSP